MPPSSLAPPSSSRPRGLSNVRHHVGGGGLLFATPVLMPTMALPVSAAHGTIGAHPRLTMPAFGLHSAFHSPVLAPAVPPPDTGVSMFGLTSATSSPQLHAMAQLHLGSATSSPKVQPFRLSADDDSFSSGSSAFSSRLYDDDTPDGELDGWYGFDGEAREHFSSRSKALLGSGEIGVPHEEDGEGSLRDDLSSAPELHLLKVISRANSAILPPDEAPTEIPMVDLTFSSPSSVASLPLTRSPAPNSPPLLSLTAPMPALQRSQSENSSYTQPAMASNQPMYTPSPRMTGSLSKFRVPIVAQCIAGSPPKQVRVMQVAPPTSMLAATVPPPSSVAKSHLKVRKEQLAPIEVTRSFVQLLDPPPSTPVPVGAQWKLLSSRPALSAHCMSHFEAIDEVKHQILERASSLLATADPGSFDHQHQQRRELFHAVSAMFEAFRGKVIQLYIRRAKAQAQLDEKARKAGIVLPKEEEAPVHWALTIPPVVPNHHQQQPTPAVLAAQVLADPADSGLDRRQPTPLAHVKEEHPTPSATGTGSATVASASASASSGVKMEEQEDAEITSLLQQGDEEQRMDVCVTPTRSKEALAGGVSGGVDGSFIGRHPPPLARRAQSVLFRQPSPAVCRELKFDRSSSSAAHSSFSAGRCRTTTPSFRNRQAPSNAPLQLWFLTHQSDPYPSPDEKDQLCAATGLTQDQLGHWFINARMRQWDPVMKEQYKRRSASAQAAQEIEFELLTKVAATGANAPVDTSSAGMSQSDSALVLGALPSKRRKLSNSSDDAEDAEHGGRSSSEVKVKVGHVQSDAPTTASFAAHEREAASLASQAASAGAAGAPSSGAPKKAASKKAKKRPRY